jgi:hypothetical protein
MEPSTNSTISSSIQTIAPSSVAINLLALEINDRLNKHQDNGENAAAAILEALDNVIRIGWALSDIKHEMKGDSDIFNHFVDRNLPISVTQAHNYARVARSFDRDEENIELTSRIREMAGLDPLLIDVSVPKHLKQQIKYVRSNLFQDLLRTAGVSKGKKQLELTDRKPPEPKPAFLRLGKSISTAWVRFVRINKESPISGWGNEERKAVKEELKPLVDLYNQL